MFTIKIKAMQEHLAKYHKDSSTKRKLELWMGKRRKMLKYLRRTVRNFIFVSLNIRSIS